MDPGRRGAALLAAACERGREVTHMQLPELTRFVYRGLRLNRVSRSDSRRVATAQQRRLRGLVRYAVRHSPFFRRKYAGLPLDRFRLSDLPPMSKAEVLANGKDVFTVGDLRLADLRRFVADPANLGT